MVGKIPIGKSANDNDFRQIVNGEIGSAKKEVIVIAGELGSYLFPELKETAIQAIKRGIHVKVYATHAVPPNVYEEIQNLGGEIYLGKMQVKDHYLVIDGKDCIISKKEQLGIPTKIGERQAIFYTNQPQMAKSVKRLFNELAFLSFLEEDKEQSLLSRIADAIFRLVIPKYGNIVERVAND